MSKNTRNRILLTAVAALLLVVVAVGGTIAYLTATTNTVTNTFTATAIEINLDEGKLVKNEQTGKYELSTERVTNNAYPLIPDNSYPKDPTVTVKEATIVDVYLFVKFDETNNPSTYLEYDAVFDDENSGWTLVDGETNVWYRTVLTTDKVKSWVLLNATNGNAVTVKTSVDQTNMGSADDAVLKFDAWAVQKDNLTVTEAWNQVKPTT